MAWARAAEAARPGHGVGAATVTPNHVVGEEAHVTGANVSACISVSSRATGPSKNCGPGAAPRRDVTPMLCTPAADHAPPPTSFSA